MGIYLIELRGADNNEHAKECRCSLFKPVRATVYSTWNLPSSKEMNGTRLGFGNDVCWNAALLGQTFDL